MKSKTTLGLLAVLIVSIAGLAGLAYAYKGDPGVRGPNYNPEVHALLQEAINAGDYDAWLQIRQDNNLPMRGKIFQVINKENFDQYVALHNANLAGDSEKAAAIRAELGLGQGKKQGMNKQNFVDANNDEICDRLQ